jgi:glycosyltransferase involved in cell wall biosynthesis/tetratricopeptide (TPR) repeat protein
MEKTQTTVALCMIAKDKERQILTALESTKAVFDIYCLQDTGSTDKTIEVFEAYCKRNKKLFFVSKKQVGTDYREVIVDGKPTLGDFAAARQDSWNLIPEGTDFGYWIDTDDEQEGAEQIPALVQYCVETKIDVVFEVYDYANTDEQIKPLTQQRERLISLKKKGHWQNRVHENYILDERAVVLLPEHLEKLGFKIKVQHRRTAAEGAATNRRNNLIMSAQLAEEGIENFSDEMLSHLAYDHWEHQELKEAIGYYDILLGRYEGKQIPAEGVYFIVMRVAQAYQRMGRLEDAIKYCFRAVVLMPTMADGYLLMASCFADVGHWAEAEKYALKVLELGKPNTTAPINEYDYYVVPRRILMQAAINRNDLKKAIEISAEVLKLLPNNEQVRNEFYSIHEEQRTQTAVKSIGELARYYQMKGVPDTLDRLKSAIPFELLDNDLVRSKIRELKQDQLRKTANIVYPGGYSKSIVIYAGQGYEHWDGNSDITKGIGGSEGMCIQMSRELASLGNKVYVYNDCGPSDGKTFDGVTYLDHRKWSPNIKCDIFISLRVPGVFSQLIKATKQYLWLHDTDYGQQDVVNFYAPNKVIVLTDYHKQIIKANHGVRNDDAFWITRNATSKVALEYADKNAKQRDPYKVIYGSSYDRGLINLLKMWPKIKEAVPQATLDVYYGTVTMDRMIEMYKQNGNMQLANQMMQFKSYVMQMVSQLPGVRELGRISQNELYKKFKEASIWAYPTEFTEISCITAMQAQALGAVPVCTPVAALNETVNSKFGGIKIEMNNFADSVVYLLQHQEELEERREDMIEWARKEYDIKTLAKEWDTFFNNN